MNRRVVWEARARSDIRTLHRIDPRTAQRIALAVNRFAESGHGDIRKLQGGSGELRLRVGDWRVLFALNADDGAVIVSRVLNRRDAYRD